MLAACGGAASGSPVTGATPTASPPVPTPVVSPPPSAPAVSPPGSTPMPTGGAVASATAIVVGTIVPGATQASTPSTPRPTPTPSPAPGGLAQAQLKYRIVDQVGRPLFCDPDFYPLARVDEQSQADLRFATIQADAPT